MPFGRFIRTDVMGQIGLVTDVGRCLKSSETVVRNVWLLLSECILKLVLFVVEWVCLGWMTRTGWCGGKDAEVSVRCSLICFRSLWWKFEETGAPVSLFGRVVSKYLKCFWKVVSYISSGPSLPRLVQNGTSDILESWISIGSCITNNTYCEERIFTGFTGFLYKKCGLI